MKERKQTQTSKGLYRADYEHDACGVGMIVNIHAGKSHELVEDALRVLENMRHRGAEVGDDGDGAGIMIQIPHEFILLQGIAVPEKGRYGTGIVFMPKDEALQGEILRVMTEEVAREGLCLLPLRDVPTDSSCLGASARRSEPAIKQMFVTGVGDEGLPTFARTLYIIRRRIERRVSAEDFYICSLSNTTLIYKGMLSSVQLRRYYLDLSSSNLTSGAALVHSRFSTNTFPQWKLAQPFRLLSHNGEINTIRGNRGWMAARERLLVDGAAERLRRGRNRQDGQGLLPQDVLPIVQQGMSDSASLDNVLEFLVMSGLSLPHALSVLVPESFNAKNPISDDLKAFYEYHSILMEPWDGPAALLFSDGRYAGGMLDRNGLRPARYTLTKGGRLIVASEAGVLDVDPKEIARKGRLEPGKLLMVDMEEGRIYADEELKRQLAGEHPYGEWLSRNRIELEKLKSGRKVENALRDLSYRERLFGFSAEDIARTIVPMALTGVEPTASMGNDTPLAVLSGRREQLFDYFRQQFAQVTNPAIDSMRESLVMSLTEYIGRVGEGILSPSEDNCKMVRLPHPILTNTQLDLLCNIGYKGFKARKLRMTMRWGGCDGTATDGTGCRPAAGQTTAEGEGLGAALGRALDALCKAAEEAVDAGVNYLILSDREIGAGEVPIPSLLAVSAVHHHLIRVGRRVQTALIVESGEIRETMHAALLLGYGASALCPYMVFAVLADQVGRGMIQEDYATAEHNYIEAVKKGLLKIMSKMGISTIRSYRGAKIFESIGLSEELLRKYFGTEVSTIGGIGLDEIAAAAARLRPAEETEEQAPLQNIGRFTWRKDGLAHAWNPETIVKLQQACRLGDYEQFKAWARLVDEKEGAIFIRDLMDFAPGEGGAARGIPIDEVEPVDSIVKRFVTGAMSFGALSKEAHETLALAMNRLGARSNTGEGGEDNSRYHSDVDGVSLSSKTKQVASGRFGVTAEYLVNAEEIQIKVAQGAKPGEGGQLPGFKVNEVIAKTRHSIPGITLISPPPHHDIYSIEDLAQLIFDLKNVNPRAAVSVKLVAESGVGTIAAGVAKAKADLIVISGAEGGTGASPSSSMRYAGISPEIGLSETQQTLVRNGLRGGVRLQVDGQLKTAKDVVMMALLGADEFAFGTAALIVMGCVMMRKCNTNTCPMGVATQNAELRKHFAGKAVHVVNYFTMLAQQVREYLAAMGARSLKDIVGHTELIGVKDAAESTCKGLDFSRLLQRETEAGDLCWNGGPFTTVRGVKDEALIADARRAIESKESVSLAYDIKNTDRAVGTMLSGVIAKRYGEAGLPPASISIALKGSAGQSFGAFAVRGLALRLEGECNDYFGKGLSGGRIVILPPKDVAADFAAEDNIIGGNTGLYGATSGELYVRGKVGERFGVRNSGATAVVEGVGDHCCEYMTGGRIVVLGKTGRNFAAGMSGGLAYVWDPDHNFDYNCNMDMVELSLVESRASRSELLGLISQHAEHTGSLLAKRMIANWESYVGDFIEVVPIEYKRVMEEELMKRLQDRISDIQREY